LNPSESEESQPPTLPEWPLPDRVKSALKILALPFRYKVCTGCESIVGVQVNHCPNCHGYRFDPATDRVVRQAKILASRPQTTVTAADLLN
jgi:hypothetical protein